ncbi:sensor histidine kinase [Flammeovirga aprica]|uniref:Histidine kinase n=1 Tax=Flammeovirga aprica JL-4 TaxID=694437 RepID=A0A7X9RTU5_9BACT|nr:histidine kinase [Flammeovirga aprica]NME67984.1 histidine kinase [Flammeovirga aprica JL-4]
MKNITPNLIFILLGISLYNYFLYDPEPQVAPYVNNLETFLWFAFGTSLFVIGGAIPNYLYRKRNILFQVASRGIGSVVMFIPLYYTLNYYMERDLEPIVIFDLSTKIIILFTVLLIAILVIEFLVIAYQQYSSQHIYVIQNKRKASELRLEALKDQLSPHYLFNSLNTVAYLVTSNANQAEKYIRSIAKTYQYVMRYADQPLISIHDEIQLVKAFAFQLKTRHGESVEVEVENEISLIKGNVPPLSIQMLVENAVKHNVLSDKTPVHISIKYDERTNAIIVSNNITKTPRKRSSTKVGLENIKERYALMNQSQITIQKLPETYTVQLPLLSS